MNIYLPLLLCIIGLLVYGLTDGKISQVGLFTFFAGLLVTLFTVYSGHYTHLF